MDLLKQIVERARAHKQRIVLPEAEEERTLKAADKVLADDIAEKHQQSHPHRPEEQPQKRRIRQTARRTS